MVPTTVTDWKRGPAAPVLIVLAGLPGAGKSAVADDLGRALGCAVLAVDPAEAAMWRAGVRPPQPTHMAAYEIAETLAAEQVALGRDVIIDAVNGPEEAREQWRQLAGRLAVPLLFVEVVCSDDAVHRDRLAHRHRQIAGYPEPTWEAVLQRRAAFPPWTDDRLTVDTVRSREANVRLVLGLLDRQRVAADGNTGLLVALAGLPGSGKSAVAEDLGRALGCAVLSVDPVEAAMWRAGVGPSEPTGLAAYVVVEALAEEQLALGHEVVVDAVNSVEPARGQWRALAERLGVRLAFIEVVCSDAHVHRRRLAGRRRDIAGFYEPGWSDVQERRKEFAEWTDARLTVDSMADREHNLRLALEYLGGPPG